HLAGDRPGPLEDLVPADLQRRRPDLPPDAGARVVHRVQFPDGVTPPPVVVAAVPVPFPVRQRLRDALGLALVGVVGVLVRVAHDSGSSGVRRSQPSCPWDGSGGIRASPRLLVTGSSAQVETSLRWLQLQVPRMSDATGIRISFGSTSTGPNRNSGASAASPGATQPRRMPICLRGRYPVVAWMTLCGSASMVTRTSCPGWTHSRPVVSTYGWSTGVLPGSATTPRSAANWL